MSINPDLLAYVATVSKALADLPKCELPYGDYYVREVVVYFGDGPGTQEKVGSFSSNDFGGYDYEEHPPVASS